jgi:tRNA threonylcarbamoyladenosine biosynthesis protein TsaB
MWTLLIESSTERAMTAIFEDEVCRYFSCLPVGYESSRFLVPKVEEGLRELELKPENLDLIAVGSGPGSYTGTRVGVVVAKSMAYACNKPLVGVNSLLGFTPDRDVRFAAVVDAKLSGAIIQKGNRLGDKMNMEGKPELISWEQVGSYLEGVLLLVTPNATRIKPKLQELVPSGTWEWEETAPDPYEMVKIALQKFEAGEFSTDGNLEISYIK